MSTNVAANSVVTVVSESHAEKLIRVAAEFNAAHAAAFNATLSQSAKLGAKHGKAEALKYLKSSMKDRTPAQTLAFYEALAAK